MNLNLFTCSGGGYLMTPQCMLASAQAQILHGSVQEFRGVVDCSLFPDAIRRHIEAQVELCAFAFLSLDAGHQLLAIRRTARATGIG